MSEKVVSIQRKRPDPQVLALCKRLLERAEAGDLLSVAVAFETESEGMEDDYALAIGCQPEALVGQIDLVLDDVKAACRHVRKP